MDWKFGQRDRQGFLCGIAAPADDCYGGISTASATWCLLDLFVCEPGGECQKLAGAQKMEWLCSCQILRR